MCFIVDLKNAKSAKTNEKIINIDNILSYKCLISKHIIPCVEIHSPWAKLLCRIKNKLEQENTPEYKTIEHNN